MANEMSLSIDGESIPFTMQAEVGHMTIEEAIASGFFDLPDEPGMVCIPVSINVWLPNSILFRRRHRHHRRRRHRPLTRAW